ncbi:MAG: GAF domain-containing protein [Myxococcales bacterium]|nr:GAF domain-containing protein [Myxococcales bacterium]
MGKVEVEALLALSEALLPCPDVEAMLAVLVDEIARLLAVEHVSIRLLDVSGVVLATQARAGDPFHNNVGFEFVMGEGLVGWVAKHLQPIRVARAEEDPRFSPRPDQQRPLGAYLAVPLREGDRCLGVISAVSEVEGHFTEVHAQTLALIAGFAAPHLRFARLRRTATPDPTTFLVPAERLDPLLLSADGPPTMAVLRVDLDELEKLRAQKGVGFADLVRKSVAASISNAVRGDDVVVQLEAGAFLVLLRDVALPTAMRIAERTRRLVLADLERHRSTANAVALSFAVAERKPGESRDALFGRLSVALASARSTGRIEAARSA